MHASTDDNVDPTRLMERVYEAQDHFEMINSDAASNLLNETSKVAQCLDKLYMEVSNLSLKGNINPKKLEKQLTKNCDAVNEGVQKVLRSDASTRRNAMQELGKLKKLRDESWKTQTEKISGSIKDLESLNEHVDELHKRAKALLDEFQRKKLQLKKNLAFALDSQALNSMNGFELHGR